MKIVILVVGPLFIAVGLLKVHTGPRVQCAPTSQRIPK
jgi:hypothetical protein